MSDETMCRHSIDPAIRNDSSGKSRVSKRKLNTVRFRRLIIVPLPFSVPFGS